MCVCFCLGACVYAYSCVWRALWMCVCVYVGGLVRGKNLPFDSLTTHCVQQKYWVLVAWLHFFCPQRFLKYNFSGRGSQMGVTHMYFFFSRGNQNDWCYFSGNNIKEKHMKWKCHMLSFFFFFFRKGWTGFKNSEHSVWLLDKTLWALTKWQ